MIEAKSLADLSRSSDVTARSRFRDTTKSLARRGIGDLYEQEREMAPRRASSFFMGHSGKLSRGWSSNRQEEHLAIALWRLCGLDTDGIALTEGDRLHFLDYQFPLKASHADLGVGKVDLLGVVRSPVGGVQLCVVELKIHRGSPENPLRAVLEALSYAAVVHANTKRIGEELDSGFDGLRLTTDVPRVIAAAPEAYWHDFGVAHGRAGWLPAIRALMDSIQRETTVRCSLLNLGRVSVDVPPGEARPVLRGELECSWVTGRTR